MSVYAFLKNFIYSFFDSKNLNKTAINCNYSVADGQSLWQTTDPVNSCKQFTVILPSAQEGRDIQLIMITKGFYLDFCLRPFLL